MALKFADTRFQKQFYSNAQTLLTNEQSRYHVLGAKINPPAIWVLSAITIDGNLAGPIGMLLGVPAASAAYALIREATQNREAEMNEYNSQAHLALGRLRSYG